MCPHRAVGHHIFTIPFHHYWLFPSFLSIWSHVALTSVRGHVLQKMAFITFTHFNFFLYIFPAHNTQHCFERLLPTLFCLKTIFLKFLSLLSGEAHISISAASSTQNFTLKYGERSRRGSGTQHKRIFL